MAVSEMSKYFSVVINKPIEKVEGTVPFNTESFGSLLNVMYPFYACILHDSDIDEDTGNPVIEHIHIVLQRGGRCRISTLINELHKWLGYPCNCISVRIPGSWNRSLRYLIHIDNPEKAPYSALEVNTNNQSEFDRALIQLVDFVSYNDIYRCCEENILLPNIIKALGMDTYNKYWRVVKAIIDEPIFKLKIEHEQQRVRKQYLQEQIELNKKLGLDEYGRPLKEVRNGN